MQKKESIVVITGNYFPEDTAIGLYTTQFSVFLKQKGFDVKVITGFPNYPQWKIRENYKFLPKFYSEKHANIEIIRYKQYVPKVVDFRGRVFMMFSLLYGTFINAFKIKNADLVICIVPFTISVLPALFISKKHHAKLWIHIQDFEFDLALDSGIIKKNSIVFNFLKKAISTFEKKMLNSADITSSISNNMLKKIKEKSKHKYPYFFPNWVSSEKINPEISKNHNLINSCKFSLLYSGNIGEKQDWSFLEMVCNLIKPTDNIEIVIVGDGGYKNSLLQKLSKFSFVQFYDPVPYVELNDLLCSANVHFLFQKMEVVDTIMPSKILGMMASSKPSIITGNKNSEVYSIFNESKGGFYYYENDSEKVYQTIINLKNDRNICTETGERARKYVLSKFSENQILENFYKELKIVLS